MYFIHNNDDKHFIDDEVVPHNIPLHTLYYIVSSFYHIITNQKIKISKYQLKYNNQHPPINFLLLARMSASFHGRKFQLIGPALFRSFRNLWMLEELGIPYEHVLAIPHCKKVKSNHPLGKVPILVEVAVDSSHNKTPFVMYESAAINTYLGDLVNSIKEGENTPLVPKPGTHERGLYEQTVSCIITELDSQGLWIHRKHHDLGRFFGSIPQAVQHAKEHFDKVNGVLITQIEENPNGKFLVGSAFTAADILYVHCLDWSKAIGWDDQWQDNEILLQYLQTCKTRPAYQKVAAMRRKEEDPFITMKEKVQPNKSKL